MPNNPTAFLRACIRNGFIIDANLFLLLAFETSHKRTAGMDEELIVCKTVTSYCSEKGGKLILTPHIIAEISNMLTNREKRFNFTGDDKFIRMTQFLREAYEHLIPKELILENRHLAYIGFTDLSILEAAKGKGFGVLTVDNELFCRLANEDCQVVNPKIISDAKTLRILMSQ